jgi:hypothetical protein
LQVARGNPGGTESWSNGDPNYQVVKPNDTPIGISNEDPLSRLYGVSPEFNPSGHIYLADYARTIAQPTLLPAKPPVAASQPKDKKPITPFFKWGIGGEIGFKGSKGLIVSGEPYFKGSFALSPQVSINFKFKYTPQGKLTIKPVDINAKPPDPPKPAKISLDVGTVFNKEFETGLSWDFSKPNWGAIKGAFSLGAIKGAFSWGAIKGNPLLHPNVYVSSKNRNNILVDTAQVKGKIPFGKIRAAIGSGPIDKNDPSKGVKGWKSVRKAASDTEGQFSAEKGWYKGPESAGTPTLFTNVVGKSTFADSPAFRPTPRWAGATGFAVGTGASFVGAKFTDTFGGRYIHNTFWRQTVDGAGGVATGIVANHVTGVVAPQISKVPQVARAATAVKALATTLANQISKVPRVERAAKAVKALATTLATSGAGKAIGSFLSKEGPAIVQDTKFAARFRFGARVAGPVGAAIAAAPDVISAVNSFAHGHVAAGFTSLADGAIRAGATVAGAAVGQALIPIPGVGAAIGGVVGGAAGDFIVGHQAQLVGAAKTAGHAVVSTGKTLVHAASAVANFFGL